MHFWLKGACNTAREVSKRPKLVTTLLRHVKGSVHSKISSFKEYFFCHIAVNKMMNKTFPFYVFLTHKKYVVQIHLIKVRKRFKEQNNGCAYAL